MKIHLINFQIDMKKSLLTTLSILFIATVGHAIDIPIQAEFSNKIVYSMDSLIDSTAFKEDCAKRGGRFNSCGSMCDDSKPEIDCVDACVNTCELTNPLQKELNNSVSTYTVERVIDGDTIVVTTPEGKSEKVHLIGIDTPESKPNDKAKRDAERTGQDLETINKMGYKATKYVEKIFILNMYGWNSASVKLEFDVQERDKYGRLLAYIYFPAMSLVLDNIKGKDGYHLVEFDGIRYIFLNATIIKSGYAQPMTIPPNVKYAQLFATLYRQAWKEERGLWKGHKGLFSEKEYYEDGSVKSILAMNKERNEGTLRGYYKTGELETEGRVKDMEGGCGWMVMPIEGPVKTYYKSGKLKSEGNWENNCAEGVHTNYYPDGKIQYEVFYEKNIRVKRRNYNSDDSLHEEIIFTDEGE